MGIWGGEGGRKFEDFAPPSSYAELLDQLSHK